MLHLQANGICEEECARVNFYGKIYYFVIRRYTKNVNRIANLIVRSIDDEIHISLETYRTILIAFLIRAICNNDKRRSKYIYICIYKRVKDRYIYIT